MNDFEKQELIDTAAEAEVLRLKYLPPEGKFPPLPNAYDFSRLAGLVATVARSMMESE